jgi:hypothetical protein
MLHGIADAICDRPADSAEQRAVRRRVVMETAKQFQPCGAVEMMLVGMVIAHAHLLEDAIHDAFQVRDDRVKARTKSSIAGLDRGMFGFLKELRMVQDRRRKAEAVASEAEGAVGMADGGAVAVNPSARTPASMTQPVTRAAMTNKPAKAMVEEPPEPRLPQLRGSETSVAAMMAVLSPAMPPSVISAAPRGENSPPRMSNTRRPGIDTASDRAAARAA